MSDKQTNIPTVEDTNRKLSEPIRPAGYQAPRQAVQEVPSQDETIESNEDQTDEAPDTLSCDQCDFEAKTANGLKSHQSKHKTK